MLLTWLYIVCKLIRHVLLIRSGHTELLIRSGYAAILFASSVEPSVAKATWRHCLSQFIDRVAARTCCAVDFFFFLLSWPSWTRSVVKHNMLKGYREARRICSPYIFSTAKMVTRTQLSVTLLARFLLFERNNLSFTFVNIHLSLFLLTWRIGWAPNNARKWQMGFN